MLKIDKCPDDEERDKNPVGDRHLRREALPDRQKKKGGNQFHGEIAGSSFAAAAQIAARKFRFAISPWNWLPPFFFWRSGSASRRRWRSPTGFLSRSSSSGHLSILSISLFQTA